MSEETNRIKIRELPDSDLTAQDLVALAKSDIEKTVHATIRDVIKAGLNLDAGNGIQIDTTDTGYKIINTGELDTSDLDQQIANLQAELDALKLAMNNMGMGVVAQPEPPTNASQGTLWWDTNTAAMYIRYNGVWIQSNLSTSGSDLPVANTDVLGGVKPDDSFQIRHDGALKLSHNVTLASASHDHDGDGVDDAVRWTPNTSYYKNQLVRGPASVDQNDPQLAIPVTNLVYNTTKAHTSSSNFLNDRNRGLLNITSTVNPAEGAQLNLENPAGGHYSVDTYQDVTNWFGRGADRTYMRLHDNTGSGTQILFDLKDKGGAWMVDSDDLTPGDSSPLIPWCCGGGGTDFKYIDRKQLYYQDSTGQTGAMIKEYDWVTVDVSDVVPSTATGLIIHVQGWVDHPLLIGKTTTTGITYIDVKSDKFTQRNVMWVEPVKSGGNTGDNGGTGINTFIIPYTSKFQVRVRFKKPEYASSDATGNKAWVYIDGYVDSDNSARNGDIGRIWNIGTSWYDSSFISAETGPWGGRAISSYIPTGDWLVHLGSQENSGTGHDEEEWFTYSKKHSVAPGEYLWFRAHISTAVSNASRINFTLSTIITRSTDTPDYNNSGWQEIYHLDPVETFTSVTPGEFNILAPDTEINNGRPRVGTIQGFAIEIVQNSYQDLADRVKALEDKPAATVDLSAYAKKSDLSVYAKKSDIPSSSGGRIIRIISGRELDLQHNTTGYQIPGWTSGDQLFYAQDNSMASHYWKQIIPTSSGKLNKISDRLNVGLTTGGKLKSSGSGNANANFITFFHIRGSTGYTLRTSGGRWS